MVKNTSIKGKNISSAIKFYISIMDLGSIKFLTVSLLRNPFG